MDKNKVVYGICRFIIVFSTSFGGSLISLLYLSEFFSKTNRVLLSIPIAVAIFFILLILTAFLICSITNIMTRSKQKKKIEAKEDVE